jgi:hypothetical protein
MNLDHSSSPTLAEAMLGNRLEASNDEGVIRDGRIHHMSVVRHPG